MHLSHIPQHIIQKRNVDISVLNGALWDMGQVYCEICAIGLIQQDITAPKLRIPFPQGYNEHPANYGHQALWSRRGDPARYDLGDPSVHHPRAFTNWHECLSERLFRWSGRNASGCRRSVCDTEHCGNQCKHCTDNVHRAGHLVWNSGEYCTSYITPGIWCGLFVSFVHRILHRESGMGYLWVLYIVYHTGNPVWNLCECCTSHITPGILYGIIVSVVNRISHRESGVESLWVLYIVYHTGNPVWNLCECCTSYITPGILYGLIVSVVSRISHRESGVESLWVL